MNFYHVYAFIEDERRWCCMGTYKTRKAMERRADAYVPRYGPTARVRTHNADEPGWVNAAGMSRLLNGLAPFSDQIGRDHVD